MHECHVFGIIKTFSKCNHAQHSKWEEKQKKKHILKNDLCTQTVKSGFNLQEEIKTFGAMTLILALEKEEPLRCISCTMIQPPSCTPSRPPKCELQIGHLGDDVSSMGGHKFR